MLISRPIRLRTTSAPCSPVNSFTTTSNNYIAVNIVVFPKRYRLAQPFPILILAIYRATTSRSSKCCHSRTGNFENTCKSVEQLFRMIFTNYKVINANCTFRSLSMKFSTVLHLGKYASLGTQSIHPSCSYSTTNPKFPRNHPDVSFQQRLIYCQSEAVNCPPPYIYIHFNKPPLEQVGCSRSEPGPR